MASSNMQYYVRTDDGREYGPAEQDVLIQWAKDGRVTASCQVRNSLVKKWQPSRKIPFLKDVVRDDSESVKQDKKKTQEEHEQEAVYSLNKAGKFKYVAASAEIRLAAWCLDMAILGVFFLLLLIPAYRSVPVGEDIPMALFSAVTAVGIAGYFLYYMLIMGLRAQTLGQWFFGIMVVRPNGKPVLMGRAFAFSFFNLLFWWTTLFFVYIVPAKRGLQDLCSGLVVTRITVREIAQASV